jgi:hypothetical protein
MEQIRPKVGQPIEIIRRRIAREEDGDVPGRIGTRISPRARPIQNDLRHAHVKCAYHAALVLASE